VVNNACVRLIAVRVPPDPLPSEDLARRVTGPIYDLAHLKAHIDPEFVRSVTGACDDDLQDLGWTLSDVVTLITEIEYDDYHCSEWCKASANYAVDCDAYVVRLDLKRKVRSNVGVEMYVKFGARPNLSFVLIISCHETRSKK
jgi:hypothetical protein